MTMIIVLISMITVRMGVIFWNEHNEVKENKYQSQQEQAYVEIFNV